MIFQIIKIQYFDSLKITKIIKNAKEMATFMIGDKCAKSKNLDLRKL